MSNRKRSREDNTQQDNEIELLLDRVEEAYANVRSHGFHFIQPDCYRLYQQAYKINPNHPRVVRLQNLVNTLALSDRSRSESASLT